MYLHYKHNTNNLFSEAVSDPKTAEWLENRLFQLPNLSIGSVICKDALSGRGAESKLLSVSAEKGMGVFIYMRRAENKVLGESVSFLPFILRSEGPGSDIPSHDPLPAPR